MTVTRQSNNTILSIEVVDTSTSNALLSGTFPVTYRLTTGAVTSDSYILVTVADPSQRTPVIVHVDPQVSFVDLPSLIIGNIRAVQVCITPDTSTASYLRAPVVSLSETGTETTTSVGNGGIRVQGTPTNVQNRMSFVRITKNALDTYLIPGSQSRTLRVNVSNTSSGGNGSCNFGTASTISLRPLELERTHKKPVIKLRQRN
jgi:hypothetical protein